MSSAELPPEARDGINLGEPVEPKPAATVILLRRGGSHSSEGLEVLMVKRTEEAKFMPGVWVFPGGRVDPEDFEGREDEDAHICAALRELAEEAGIEVDSEAGECLAWSRWITPEIVPRRYDTRFYVALAPAHAKPKADGEEMTEAAWISPAEALRRGESDEMPLSFPTIRHLEGLAEYSSADEVLEAARARTVDPILPKVVATEDGGHRIALPDDPDYPSD
jgi:8-oxo-dGTP pyrophosphatase MutT (NUDIX family)